MNIVNSGEPIMIVFRKPDIQIYLTNPTLYTWDVIVELNYLEIIKIKYTINEKRNSYTLITGHGKMWRVIILITHY